MHPRSIGIASNDCRCLLSFLFSFQRTGFPPSLSDNRTLRQVAGRSAIDRHAASDGPIAQLVRAHA